MSTRSVTRAWRLPTYGPVLPLYDERRFQPGAMDGWRVVGIAKLRRTAPGRPQCRSEIPPSSTARATGPWPSAPVLAGAEGKTACCAPYSLIRISRASPCSILGDARKRRRDAPAHRTDARPRARPVWSAPSTSAHRLLRALAGSRASENFQILDSDDQQRLVKGRSASWA